MPRVERQEQTGQPGPEQTDTEPAADYSATLDPRWEALRQDLCTRRETVNQKASRAWEKLVRKHGRPDDPKRTAKHVRRLVTKDAFARDEHLAKLDPWLLVALHRRQLDVQQLMDVVVYYPAIRAIAAPEAGLDTPVLWRWLRDAEQRGLVKPERDDASPSLATQWSLSDEGNSAAVRWKRLFTTRVLGWPTRTSGRTQAVVAIVAAIIGAAATIVGTQDFEQWVGDTWPYWLGAIGYLVIILLTGRPCSLARLPHPTKPLSPALPRSCP
jgi:hypothetical protein